jgi:hypothetical protein
MQEYKEGATMDAPTILKANDPRVADLVRAGRIRLGLFLPLYTEGPVTRELRGALGVGALAHEIARAIAARLRIEVQVVGFSHSAHGRGMPKGWCVRRGIYGYRAISGL